MITAVLVASGTVGVGGGVAVAARVAVPVAATVAAGLAVLVAAEVAVPGAAAVATGLATSVAVAVTATAVVTTAVAAPTAGLVAVAASVAATVGLAAAALVAVAGAGSVGLSTAAAVGAGVVTPGVSCAAIGSPPAGSPSIGRAAGRASPSDTQVALTTTSVIALRASAMPPARFCRMGLPPVPSQPGPASQSADAPPQRAPTVTLGVRRQGVMPNNGVFVRHFWARGGGPGAWS